MQNPKTYALVWKNRKAIITVETKLSNEKTTWIIERYVGRNPTPDDSMRLHSVYNIAGIRATEEFKKCGNKLIGLIKGSIKAHQSVSILNSGTFVNKNTFEIKLTADINFLDEVV